ncbi:flagellar assembly protein FliW [Cellulomonas fimi]|uniref:Flagellar assembly factor FliW n=1 Tax=Cellulomonas fimi (strain ATCC 484 / DSM 20113 / JCM 1341 / CCUG 24087 / LMG 16345 / NBRC 15513 / NCIMB 8980 / NCTC 7547 / NRS-133) TaxID=590998 RepID=F4GYT0_CELFA|nr:flagellar assembly protein FliW [Cellulomonas fimi]AEE44799.1 protein of unknown function DUF180 [Cellulomonas fimi ATCC 484]NNH08385.1 flagellar assembly protein FliW [Cellulomonas fimi]VEH27325.1 Flagellar assembly factor FliW [Cellulomonas fimi]
MNLAPTTVPVAVGGDVLDVPSELHLVAPLPGLPGRTRYVLDALDEAGVLFALRSAGDDEARDVRLFVVSPTLYFPDYHPRTDASVLGDGTDPADVVVLVVVHPGSDDAAPTANLLAPVLVDRARGTAVQCVLDEDWPLRAPVG